MQERSDALAFRYGAIIGAADGVLALLLVLLIAFVKRDPGILLVGCVGFLASFALLVEAGHITAKQTGTISSGALAGAIAGFLMGAGLSTLSILQEIGSGKLRALGQVGITLGTLLSLFFFGALCAGLGVGLGVLGSLIGRASFRRARSNEMAVNDTVSNDTVSNDTIS